MFLGALLIALIVPVAAGANSVPTTGSRIAFFTPPTTYPADTPFYIEQGFVCYRDANAADCANAGTSFVLCVDGVQQPPQKDIDQITIGGTPGIFVRYLRNFPQGLPAGSHTFTGDFYFKTSSFGRHARGWDLCPDPTRRCEPTVNPVRKESDEASGEENRAHLHCHCA